MNKVEEVLSRFVVPRTALGDGGASRMDRQALRVELSRLGLHLRSVFWIAAAMVLIVFGLEIAVAARYLQTPAVLAGVAGAAGLTVAGAIAAMRRLGKEMAEVNMLVILSGELSDDQIGTVVGTLVGRLR